MSSTTSDVRPLDDLGPQLFGDNWPTAPAARWVEHAWGVLTEAGMTPLRPEPEHANYADQVVTAAALVFFAALFADDDREGSVLPPEIAGNEPLLSDLAIGRYAERRGIHSGQSPESSQALASLAVRQRMPTVARALVTEIGVAWLFAELWVMSHPEQLDGWPWSGTGRPAQSHSLPLPDETVYQVLNTLSVAKMITFEWLNEIAPGR